MTYRPLRDMVLLSPEPMETESAGGIILPEKSQAYPGVARVVARGPEAFHIPVGERVIYDHNEATWLKLDGEDCFLLPLEAVLAIWYKENEECQK